MNHFSKKAWLFFIGIILSGCAYTPLLKTHEYLLDRQKIKGNENVNKDNLTPLYQQLPNRRVAGIGTKAYLYFYLIGRRAYDSTANNAAYDSLIQKIDRELASTQTDTTLSHDLNLKYDKILKKMNQKLHENHGDSSKQLKIHKKYSKDLLKLNQQLKIANDDTLKKLAINNKYEKKLKKLKTKATEGNFMMRVMGEPPSLFDTLNINATKEQLKNYYYTNGYLNAEVNTKFDTSIRNIQVTYLIKENPPLTIKNIYYEIPDSNIAKTYFSDSVHSLIKKGMIYSETAFVKERERTYKLMRDNGFYYFSKNLMFIDIDTSGHPNEADLYFVIKKPEGENLKKYSIKSITVYVDDKAASYKNIEEFLYDNKKFIFHGKRYSRKILNSKIAIQKDSLYNASSVQKTQNRLSQLQMFKFVNVTIQQVSDSLAVEIRASSLPKYQISDEIGVNTNINRQIPGPYGSVTFTNRNTFRGCEIFDLSLSGGIEGQISNTDVNKFIRTTEINGNAGLTFPQLLLPTRLKYNFLDYNPRTRISVNYNSSYRPDYDRTEIKGSLSYQLQLSNFTRLFVAPIELNLINASINDTSFGSLLKKLESSGSNLINNFNKSLVTDMSIVFINNNSNPLVNKKSHLLKIYGELGGLLPGIIANLTNNQLTQNDQILGIPYYKYWKIGADYRIYKPILKKSTFAMRFSSNLVSSFSSNGNGIPYTKYLYAGGISSNRAWKNRRLGPGNYAVKNADGTISYRIEQPGEFNIESSIEGRFKIYKFIGLGVFADFGNVWNIKKESGDKRPNSMLDLSKINTQIAVGTGIGLRLDFSFFVFRLDAGIKTYDPARESGERFRLFKLTGNDLLGKNEQTVYSFGIGYPF